MADPALQARAYRIAARLLRCRAAAFDLAAASIQATSALTAFRQAVAEADLNQIAAHPDLAYLNLQTRGFYDHG